MRITSELASPIVSRLQEILDYNINIMNEQGIIVASGQKNRINHKHEGALQVLKTDKEFIISKNESENLLGTKPGVNLPIIYYKEIVGVVGITGSPKEVYHIAKIAKMNVELMLQQIDLYKKRNIKARLFEELIMELTKSNNNDWNYEKALEIATNLDVAFDIKRSVIILDIKEARLIDRIIEQISMNIDTRSLISYIDNGLVFLAIPFVGEVDSEMRLARKLRNHVQEKGDRFIIGIGNRYSGLEGYRKSFFEARKSIELAEKMIANPTISHINEWKLIKLLNEVPKNTQKDFMQDYLLKLEKLDEELLNTMEVFLDNNLDYKKSADQLFVHRNTLIYRIEKINKLLELNCKVFKDAVMARIILIYYKLSKSKA